MSIRWTEEEYEKHLAKARNTRKMSANKRSSGNELPKTNVIQEKRTRKSKGCNRVCIEITSFRRRVSDPDNIFSKWIVDSLVPEILPDDSCLYVKNVLLEVELIEAPEEERTVIEIFKAE